MADLEARELDHLWNRIITCFRKACQLRHQGQLDESMYLLEHNLPLTISQWSLEFTGTNEEKRTMLTNMFETEEQRIDNAFVMSEIVTNTLQKEIVPQISQQIMDKLDQELNRGTNIPPSGNKTNYQLVKKIPITNVVEMIDDLLNSELSNRKKKRIA